MSKGHNKEDLLVVFMRHGQKQEQGDSLTRAALPQIANTVGYLKAEFGDLGNVLVLNSPARRTTQTANLVKAHLGVVQDNIALQPLREEASFADAHKFIDDVLNNIPEKFNTVVCVTHDAPMVHYSGLMTGKSHGHMKEAQPFTMRAKHGEIPTDQSGQGVLHEVPANTLIRDVG